MTKVRTADSDRYAVLLRRFDLPPGYALGPILSAAWRTLVVLRPRATLEMNSTEVQQSYICGSDITDFFLRLNQLFNVLPLLEGKVDRKTP